jgi:hypothetical protein
MWRASRLRIAVKSCHTKRIRAAHNCGFCGNRGLIGCTVYQDANGYGNSTQVLLSGPEASVQYSDLYQKPMPKGGPTGCTGISVNNSADSCRVYGCHISDFYTGISVAQGSVFTYITDCSVDAAAGGEFATSCSTPTRFSTSKTLGSGQSIGERTITRSARILRSDTERRRSSLESFPSSHAHSYKLCQKPPQVSLTLRISASKNELL